MVLHVLSLREMAVSEIRPESTTLPNETLLAAWTVDCNNPDRTASVARIAGREVTRMPGTSTPRRDNRDRNRSRARANRPLSASSVSPRRLAASSYDIASR